MNVELKRNYPLEIRNKNGKTMFLEEGKSYLCRVYDEDGLQLEISDKDFYHNEWAVLNFDDIVLNCKHLFEGKEVFSGWIYENMDSV